MEKPELYFPRDVEWREWLHINHENYPQGVYLIFYKLEVKVPTMRWEEAVRVALSYGWIDSTVKSLGAGKRRQFYCPRRPKSEWSALNKKHLLELKLEGLIHESGYRLIERAKKDGSWSALDDVENLIFPKELKEAFQKNKLAYKNFQNLARGYKKSYLRYYYNAKRPETKTRRTKEIINLCEQNKKSRESF